MALAQETSAVDDEGSLVWGTNSFRPRIREGLVLVFRNIDLEEREGECSSFIPCPFLKVSFAHSRLSESLCWISMTWTIGTQATRIRRFGSLVYHSDESILRVCAED